MPDKKLKLGPPKIKLGGKKLQLRSVIKPFAPEKDSENDKLRRFLKSARR